MVELVLGLLSNAYYQLGLLSNAYYGGSFRAAGVSTPKCLVLQISPFGYVIIWSLKIRSRDTHLTQSYTYMHYAVRKWRL